MQTTLALIAERGIDAVNHRSVAEAADLPLGSTTYWFDSRQDMLSASLRHFAELELSRLNERLVSVRRGVKSTKRLVDAFTELMIPQLGPERADAAALYALLTEAPRHPELEGVCRAWTGAWTKALSELFTELGAPDPALEARMFLAMLDGLLLNQLAAPEQDVERKLIRPALRTWFERLSREREHRDPTRRSTK